MYSRIAGRILLAAGILGLGACTNPYDPGQRAIGGAALGAGGGAALGAIAGGGRGAAIGALAGGALGAVGGAVTTPQQNAYPTGYYQRPAPPPGRYGY
ncbi:YMGG-like glycine zipper-containing protein [Granulibacter bethesdensis]|uniref:OmpA family protein n=2 Tax=Granulibacter bethesdensis TaxID=364410 RepID=Q0BU71_GRABC|nr:OmpA family protein [Granulibacter bethesdensis CGDNIH1]AHJ62529.1 OmpA family protein [Granulibacter bethesdensis]AHJ67777.1 OmpA family protein [Granulibacter bethesdensis]APH51436.1 OmpA family protein [Granulibacter bethesdensis]APH59058.1 OmpA family protein [Granulibacter bethesdensis]